ncbi:MAG: hypothetical protein R2757_12165 [Draconibacterium sp.]
MSVPYVLHAKNSRNIFGSVNADDPIFTDLITATENKILSQVNLDAEQNIQANWTETNTTSDAFILHKPNLAQVATSGSYRDLANQPTIPTKTSQLINDKGFIIKEAESMYVADSAILKNSVREWNASVTKAITATDTTYWNSKLDSEVDGSVTNELQILSLSNDTVFLSNNGGAVKLPVETDPVFSAWNKSNGVSITESQISDLGVYIETEIDPVYTADSSAIKAGVREWNTSVAKAITATNTTFWNSKLDTEVDGSVTNELQILSLSNDTIFLSNNGGAVKLPAPSSAAGGDLTGTYPNPSIASNVITTDKILDGAITDIDINAAAAIAYSKLDLSNSIVASDLTTSAVTTDKLNNGAVTVAKIGTSSGTPSSSTYLRGDGTWAAPATGAALPTDAATGDMAYYNGSSWVKIAAPANEGMVLTYLNGSPVWAAPKVTTVALGEEAYGGIVFHIFAKGETGYVAGEQHGLVCSAADASNTMYWSPAVLYCNSLAEGGYSDWFLPTLEQLGWMYNTKDIIGGFSDGAYWSSLEDGSSWAYWFGFYDGGVSASGVSTSTYFTCVPVKVFLTIYLLNKIRPCFAGPDLFLGLTYFIAEYIAL